MAYLTGFDRQQASLFPRCIDDVIAKDSIVRLIDLFVDSLDLKQLGFIQPENFDNGRPSYHPGDLFKLYMYGYLNRIRTSRLLEREYQRNLDLYRKRQEIIEHVFRTIKRQWGYDHILMKGFEKNNGEFGLIYLIYNFRKLINILGPTKAKKWLKSLFSLNLVHGHVVEAYINKHKKQIKNLLSPFLEYTRMEDRGFCTN